MELYNLNSFKRPYLKFDDLSILNDSEFELKFEELELCITSEDSRGVAATLESLRSPEAPLWKEIMARRHEGPLSGLLDSLQHYGFVYESVGTAKTVETSNQQVSDLCTELYSLAQKIKLPSKKILEQLRAQLQDDASLTDMTILTGERNLFQLSLRLSFKAWRNICPPVITIAGNLLDVLLDQKQLPLENVALECYAFSEVRRCLLVFFWCLNRSCDVDAGRLVTEVPHAANNEMGVNLAILTERWAVNTLAKFGPSPFTDALQAPSTQLRLAQASYAQEYYITDRFIDIIAPAISHRVPRPLKKLIRKYYSEETGHDKYELKTCERLGLSYENLQASLPTPFSQILCDVFTYLAINDPISYFSAITITEGLPGQPNILNAIVANSKTLPEFCNHDSKHHESLNETLNHPMISRIFLTQCGELEPATLHRAFEFYAALLEIGWRSWNELHRMHVEQDQPALNNHFADFFKECQG